MPRHAQDEQPRARERGPLERLLRRADAAGEDAEAAIRKTLREVRAEIALLTRETDVGRSAAAREAVLDAARKRLARLRRRLERLTGAAAEYAARQGFDAGLLAAEGIARANGDELDVHYSKERADEICALVTEGQGGNLAAVFTENMAENVVDALRSATVSAMRENAVAGGTMKDLARTLEDKWLGAAKDGETFQFVDAGGHVWDTRTYIAMNVRTNAMRVYNDSLADTIGRATGSDLVRVSRGGDPHCRLCFPWEGRILSLTGGTRGFPTYEQAREAGCFHPNCVHTLDAVDELLDGEEIELQKAHPVDMGTATPEELDENRYQIDQDRYRRRGMDAERARIAVDRDNLTAEIRAGLLREDAREIVDGMTDAQVAALCPDGNPPRFEPVKRVRGGTRKEPKYEPERWNRGSRGGVVHVRRDADLARILGVAGADKAREAKAGGKAAKPSTQKPGKDPASIEGRSAEWNAYGADYLPRLAKSLQLNEARGIIESFGLDMKTSHGVPKATEERTIREVAATLKDLKARFPDYRPGLERIVIGTPKGKGLASPDFGEARLVAARYTDKLGARSAKFRERWGYDQSAAHMDARYSFDIIRHELGHFKENAFELNAGLKEVVRNPKWLGVRFDNMIGNGIEEVLGKYATTNQHEAFAELFSKVTSHDYRFGTLPRKLEDAVLHALGERRAEGAPTPKGGSPSLASVASAVERSGKSDGTAITLQPIDSATANEIKAVCGVAPKVLTPTVGADEIRHTFKRHGKPVEGKTCGEKSKKQVPITPEDIARIPEIIKERDGIENGSFNKRDASPSVKFIRQYPDGTTYTVFIITDGMKYKTMWKQKAK